MIISGCLYGMFINSTGLSVFVFWTMSILNGRILHAHAIIIWLSFGRSAPFWCNICISKKNRRMGWSVLARLCSRKNARLLLWMICNACMIGFRRITATSFWFATFCTTCLSVRRRLPNSGCVIYPSVNRRSILTIQSRKTSVRHVLLYPRKLLS